MVNKLCVSDDVYTLFNNFIEMFCLQPILDYPWCNNPCCAYQELGKRDFYSFDQKFIHYLPTKNVTARQTILTSTLSTAFVTEWASIGL